MHISRDDAVVQQRLLFDQSQDRPNIAPFTTGSGYYGNSSHWSSETRKFNSHSEGLSNTQLLKSRFLFQTSKVTNSKFAAAGLHPCSLCAAIRKLAS